MALALIVLAIGSVVAGYVGVPAALGGHNEIEHYLAPSFAAHRGEQRRQAEQARAGARAELQLGRGGRAGRTQPSRASRRAQRDGADGRLHRSSRSPASASPGTSSSAIRRLPTRVAEAAAPVHTLLLNKYYVDEIYDAAIVRAHRRGVARRAVEGRRRRRSSTAP